MTAISCGVFHSGPLWALAVPVLFLHRGCDLPYRTVYAPRFCAQPIAQPPLAAFRYPCSFISWLVQPTLACKRRRGKRIVGLSFPPDPRKGGDACRRG
ncbi:hypothetical protein EI94DRAFT_1715414 [Lactarius quietus]|nr:hypothetical protein EI94DRAFT_1715414 [Lactarius quietus]